jgi:hypothetical protein
MVSSVWGDVKKKHKAVFEASDHSMKKDLIGERKDFKTLLNWCHRILWRICMCVCVCVGGMRVTYFVEVGFGGWISSRGD